MNMFLSSHLNGTTKRVVVGIFVFCTYRSTIDAQTPDQINARTLPDMLASPSFVVDPSAKDWAASLVATYGRQGAINTLVEFVVDNTANVHQLYVIRQLGSQLQPEFNVVILNKLDGVESPFGKGRLLLLLRNAPREQVAAISRQLSDVRTAEKITGEGVGYGGIPLRVCDVAYNVIQEIEKDHLRVPLITPSVPTEKRDVTIAASRK